MSGYDREWAVLTKIVETGNMSLPIQKGVSDAWFKDLDAKSVWRFLADNYGKHGEVPSEIIVKDQFGELYQSVELNDSHGILIERLRDKAAYNHVMQAQKKIVVSGRGHKGMEALKEFQEQALTLSVAFLESDHLDASKASGMLRERYNTLKANDGVLGLKTPWDTYTRATGGYQPGILHGWYGLTGTMKTWLLLYQAAYVHTMFGAVPLVLSKEVPKEQLAWRLSCIKAEVPYGKLNMGGLDDDEEAKFFEALQQMSDDPPFPLDYIVATGKGSVLEVQAKIRKHKPDMVCIDGVYFMADDPSNWGQMACINNGLKQLCICEKLPFSATTQRNYNAQNKKIEDDEGEQSDVGFGKSFAQAVDTLARIVRGTEEKEQKEAKIVMSKVRESMTCKFFIDAKPGESFNEKPKEPEEGEDGAEEDSGIAA